MISQQSQPNSQNDTFRIGVAGNKGVGSPSQLAFLLDDETPFPAFVGGFGSGKTTAGLGKMFRLAFKNPNVQGIVVQPTYRHFADILWPRLENDYLDIWEGPACRMNKSMATLDLFNGSRILFRSAEKPQKVVGTDAGWFWIDEAPLCNKLIWQNLVRRMRDPRAKQKQGFATFTPEIPGWCNDTWGSEELLGTPLKTGYKVYHGNTYDTSCFLGGTTYADTLVSETDPDEYQAVIGGHFTQSKRGRVYYTFDQRYNVDGSATYDPNLPLHVCFDFNQTPGMHLELSQEREGKKLYVVDEIFKKGLRLEDACDQVLDRYASRQRAGVVVFGDATGHQQISRKSHYHIISEIFTQGTYGRPAFEVNVTLDVPHANPPVSERCAAMRAMLCNAKSEIRLIINPACKRLIADLSQVVYMSAAREAAGRPYSGNPDDICKDDPNLTHASDALGYCVQRLFPQRDVFRRYNDYAERRQ